MSPKYDLIGQRFGKLVVIAPEESAKRKTRWRCMCDCGTEIITPTTSLRLSGKTSCGCDTFDKRSVKLKTHGLSKSGTYKSWMMMKSRCLNPNYNHYSYYGGRGITICQQWIDSFETFLADMGERPEGLTLDRIDSDGNYEPSNCRWVSRESQVDNRRNGVVYTYKGITLSAKEWANILGIKRTQLYLATYHGATIEGFITRHKLEHRVISYQQLQA